VNDKTIQSRDIAGKGMGFVKDPRDKYPGHARHHQSPAGSLFGFRYDCKSCRGAQLAAGIFAVTMIAVGTDLC
jgi:hypothetical protein